MQKLALHLTIILAYITGTLASGLAVLNVLGWKLPCFTELCAVTLILCFIGLVLNGISTIYS
jgi:hypothetical protein